MDLRYALILLGVVLIILVFAVSRYTHTIEKYLHTLRNKSTAKPVSKSKSHHTGLARNADHAPALGETDENQFEDQLFEFESDSFAGRGEDDIGQERAGLLIGEPEDNQEINVSQPEAGLPEKSLEIEAEIEDEAVSLASLGDEGERRKHVGPFTSLRQIDYWIKLSPASPLTQADILAKLTHWDKILFPVQLHALTQDEPHWVNLLEAQGDTEIVDVVASYQLLDGGNAATIVDLKTFDERASILGQSLNAEKLMMASPEQALDQSLKLAGFFADSCEPLEVSICAPEGQAFMGKLVETSAKQQGLDFMDGDYVRQKRMASHNVILYRMLNINRRQTFSKFDQNMSSDARIEAVKFTMMPVLSQTPGRDAKEMLDAVKAFASRVKGDIRIPGESEFHQDLLLKLRNRVSRLEKDTIAAGLEPGGQEIHRIFS